MPVSNRLMAVVMALVLIAALSAVEPPSREQEVLTADLQRFDAMIKGDAAKLESLLAAEAIYINSNARIDDKPSCFTRSEPDPQPIKPSWPPSAKRA